MVLLLFSNLQAQTAGRGEYVGLYGGKIELTGIFNGHKMTWTTELMRISLHRESGNMKLQMPVSGLRVRTKAPGFEPDPENMNKTLVLTGTIPLKEVLSRQLESSNSTVEFIGEFNDLQNPVPFFFTIVRVQTGGFACMGEAQLSPHAFQVENLKEIEGDLTLYLTFTGR